MSITPAVQTTHLEKRFGDITAINNLDFNVQQGITYGVLGSNGAGKTTLIRMLLGLLKPTSGKIAVLGRPTGDESMRQLIGYMPQSTALYEDLTVNENVDFYARLMGVSQKEQTQKTIELVALTDRQDSLISTLSGGMKTRASLACALVHTPKLLFLDEPTVGVDLKLRVQFWEHFRMLNNQGVTIVVSTHIMDEAERCDRLGLLHNGCLIAEGTSLELQKSTNTKSLEEAFLNYAQKRIDEHG